MRYSAVLFDLDGTLLDTLSDLTDSMNAVLRKNSVPTHSEAAYSIFIGDGVRTLIKRALPPERRVDAAFVDRCLAQMEEEYERRWQQKTSLYAGVSELLDGLTERGVRLTILSNKQDPFTQKIVRSFLADWSWEIVLGAREEVPCKPDPQAALEIATQLQITPADFLYLGDTNTDMQTANAAGMFAVGAEWGFRTAAELTKSGAAALAKDPQAVLDFFPDKIERG